MPTCLFDSVLVSFALLSHSLILLYLTDPYYKIEDREKKWKILWKKIETKLFTNTVYSYMQYASIFLNNKMSVYSIKLSEVV